MYEWNLCINIISLIIIYGMNIICLIIIYVWIEYVWLEFMYKYNLSD